MAVPGRFGFLRHCTRSRWRAHGGSRTAAGAGHFGLRRWYSTSASALTLFAESQASTTAEYVPSAVTSWGTCLSMGNAVSGLLLYFSKFVGGTPSPLGRQSTHIVNRVVAFGAFNFTSNLILSPGLWVDL